MGPQFDIDGVQQSHATLLDRLRSLDDADAARPTLLEGWTVGHVLTHLARNADGIANLFAAAHRGAIGDQYPGGAGARDRDIVAGADRVSGELVDDVRTSIERLAQVWGETDTATWAHGRGRTLRGELTLDEIVFRRWREVEVHHVDLHLGYAWRHWPDDYVDRELRATAAGLAERILGVDDVRIEATGIVGAWVIDRGGPHRQVVQGDKHELLAWMIGRHGRDDWPELAPW